MTKEEFTLGLRRLRAGLSKLAITAEERDFLFDELSFIPSAAWRDLIANAFDRWESWPKNFPKAVKALWYEWQRKRRATFEPTACDVCNGKGLIWYWKYHEDLQDSYLEICACGHCENYEQHFGSALTRKATDTGKSYTIKRMTTDQLAELGLEAA